MADSKHHSLGGLLCIALGGYLALITYRESTRSGVEWELLFIGSIMFTLAGIQLVFDIKGRLSNLLAGLVTAGMSYLAFHAALSDKTLEVVMPFFISPGWNQVLGRVLFGFCGLLTAAFSLWFIGRSFKLSRK